MPSHRERLIDYFSPVISYAHSIIHELDTKGSTSGAPAAVEQQLKALLKRAQDDARETGRKNADEVHDAAFAVTAWIDEGLQRHNLTYWKLEQLQFTLFKVRSAGDDVYETAKKITDNQAELAEVYFVVIGLGFEGKYYRPDARREILAAQRQLRGKLPVMPVMPRDFETDGGETTYIVPQPYAIADPPPPDPPGPPLPWRWLAGTGAVLLLMVAGITWWLWPPGQEYIDANISQVLEKKDCFRAETSWAGDGNLVMRGHAQSIEQRDRTVERLSAVDGIAGVNASAIEIVPPPFCLVADFLYDSTVVARGESALSIRGLEKAYRIGDALTFAVKAPRNRHLYVWIVDQDGDARFLFPHERNPESVVHTGADVQIGAVPGEQTETTPVWWVDGPIGDAMIVLLATEFSVLPEPPVYVVQGDDELQALLDQIANNIKSDKQDPSKHYGTREVLSSYKMTEIRGRE